MRIGADQAGKIIELGGRCCTDSLGQNHAANNFPHCSTYQSDTTPVKLVEVVMEVIVHVEFADGRQ